MEMTCLMCITIVVTKHEIITYQVVSGIKLYVTLENYRNAETLQLFNYELSDIYLNEQGD